MKTIIDRSDKRGHSLYEWLDSYHSFSFGNYYNPEKMGFGALRVLNDDIIAPKTGFDTHPHKNMEIVTIPVITSYSIHYTKLYDLFLINKSIKR